LDSKPAGTYSKALYADSKSLGFRNHPIVIREQFHITPLQPRLQNGFHLKGSPFQIGNDLGPLVERKDNDVSCESPTGLCQSVKSVKFGYRPTPSTKMLLQIFREMVNHAIHISIEEKIHGRLNLRDRIYKVFQERYEVPSCFPYSVAEVAWSIVKKHKRRDRKPIAKRLMMKMDIQNYSLNHGILSLPFRRGQRILLPLSYGNYQRSFLVDEGLKRGSITLTESVVIITFRRAIPMIEPVSRVGIDLNEKSAVCSNGNRFDLSEVARLHSTYGVRRAKFYSHYADDLRVRRKFASSRREKARVKQVLHRVAKEIVTSAKQNKEALVLERLKGIRYAHRKGNGEGPGKRRRIALWPFRSLQACILYKANWDGVPVEFVAAALTSQTCNLCQNINKSLKLPDREWRCPSCGAILDRDLNAAVNIERRGKIPCLGVVRPGAQGTNEVVKGNPTTPVVLRAEALKSI